MITLDRNALRDCVKDAVREELQVFISKVGNMDDPQPRSRGLGDVYKRQVWESAFTSTKKMLWHP